MIAIPLAMMAVGAAMSAQQASERNKAIKKAQLASIDANTENQRQVREAGDVQAMKRKNEHAMMKARLRVSGANAGVGDGVDSLLAQADYDASLNENLLQRNVINEQRRLASGLTADLTNLQSGVMNGVLSGMQGGLQGFSTGLQISSAMPKTSGSAGFGENANAGDAYQANSNQRFA